MARHLPQEDESSSDAVNCVAANTASRSAPTFVDTCQMPGLQPWRQHQQQEVSGMYYSCHSCGYETKHKSHMENHLRVHTKERPFVCRHCGRAFSDRCNQRRHERKHTGACYPCTLCARSFARKKTLLDHLKAHESNDRRDAAIAAQAPLLQQH
ncbi:zinc finger X-chromosomal protein-like [Amblyomma americanum]